MPDDAILFNLPAEAPRLFKASPLPAVNIGAIRYSILPSRAVSDPRITHRPHLLLLLAAICLHTSPAGICYPSQRRLAKICRRSPPWVSRYIRELEAMGYVQRLVSASKRKRHAARRIVIYEEGAPLPPLERPEPMPWAYPFNQQFGQPKEKAMDLAEVKQHQEDARVKEEKRLHLERETWKVADYFANTYGRLFSRVSQPDQSYVAARRWAAEFGALTAIGHIDRMLHVYKRDNPDTVPSNKLDDYPMPKVEARKNA